MLARYDHNMSVMTLPARLRRAAAGAPTSERLILRHSGRAAALFDGAFGSLSLSLGDRDRLGPGMRLGVGELELSELNCHGDSDAPGAGPGPARVAASVQVLALWHAGKSRFGRDHDDHHDRRRTVTQALRVTEAARLRRRRARA
jgi:hypothetical protein